MERTQQKSTWMIPGNKEAGMIRKYSPMIEKRKYIWSSKISQRSVITIKWHDMEEVRFQEYSCQWTLCLTRIELMSMFDYFSWRSDHGCNSGDYLNQNLHLLLYKNKWVEKPWNRDSWFFGSNSRDGDMNVFDLFVQLFELRKVRKWKTREIESRLNGSTS